MCEPGSIEAVAAVLETFADVVGHILPLADSLPPPSCSTVTLSLAFDSWQAAFVMKTSIAFFAANYVLTQFCAKPLAGALLCCGRATDAKTLKKVSKFSQSFTEMLQYASFFLCGLCVILRQPWVWPSTEWWAGHALGEHATTTVEVSAFYLLYLGRYISNFFFVVALEHRRKDFIEMVVHHAITCFLVALSYDNGFWRVGLVIMVLLDVAEPPLHLAKLAKYLYERHQVPTYMVVSNLMFYVFGITFFMTRIVFFGYVTMSVWIESAAISGSEGTLHIINIHDSLFWCMIMVMILFVLQCFWFSLIIKVAIKQAATGETSDVRSDDEEENVPEFPAEKKEL